MSTEEYVPLFDWGFKRKKKESEFKIVIIKKEDDKSIKLNRSKTQLIWTKVDGRKWNWDLNTWLIKLFENLFLEMPTLKKRELLEYHYNKYEGPNGKFLDAIYDIMNNLSPSTYNKNAVKIGLEWVINERKKLENKQGNELYSFHDIWVSQESKKKILYLLKELKIINSFQEWVGISKTANEIAGFSIVLIEKGHISKKYRDNKTLVSKILYSYFNGPRVSDESVYRKKSGSSNFFNDQIPDSVEIKKYEIPGL